MSNTISGLEGMLSPMDWRQMPPDREKIYAQADANGDGTLDKAEFGSFIDRLSQKTGAKVNADDAFTITDSNEDGVIDADEFEAGGEKVREQLGLGAPPPMRGMNTNSNQGLLDLLQISASTSGTDDSEESTTGISTSFSDYIKSLLESYTANAGVLSNGTYSYNVSA